MMLRRSIITAVVFAVALAACSSIGLRSSFGAGSTATNQNGRVILHGDVNPGAKPEFDQGPADSSLPMNGMILLLKIDPHKQAQLDRLVAEQQEPSSSHYHRWLTPEQFGRRFGQSREEIATVKNWLVSEGFTIDSVSNSRTMINFSGTAADVNRAFEANMHDYEVNGRLRHANSIDPSIPGALAELVAGPVSLNSFPFKPAHTAALPAPVGGAQPAYTVGSGGSGYLSRGYYLSPGDFAAVYDVNTIYNSLGYNGKGETIAIVGQAPADTTMWTEFRTSFGVPFNAPHVIVPPNGGTAVDDGEGDVEESDLDVEWAGAVAPGATIDFVTSSVNDGGIDTSAEYIVDNDLAPIMSCSYNLCEQGLGSSGNAFYSELWEQAAAEGITVFVVSGDSGAYDCVDSSGDPSGGKAVNGLASTPYDIAVGGTSLSDSPEYWSSNNSVEGVSALSSVPTMSEEAWNDWDSSGGWDEWASGGGASGIYSKPAWQVCPGVPSDGRRDVPDVSLNADPYSVGYLVYTCDDDTSPCASDSYGLYAFGGASCGSPSFAGIMALIEQSMGGERQGSANTVFYELGGAQYGSSGATAVFNDITSGTNGFVGNGADLPGYSCTTGYDQVTGLGSIDATNLLLGYQEAGGLWKNATNLGGGWEWLKWFYFFYTGDSPWIYHQTLCWLYPYGTSPDSIWFWDAAMNGFWWTSQTTFPFIYRAGDGTWLYYDEWTSPPLFYNFRTRKWEVN